MPEGSRSYPFVPLFEKKNTMTKIGPKNTNLAVDGENLLPVKFHLILYSGSRKEVEIVTANKRQCKDRQFVFHRPE